MPFFHPFLGVLHRAVELATILKHYVYQKHYIYQLVLHRPIECTRLLGHLRPDFQNSEGASELAIGEIRESLRQGSARHSAFSYRLLFTESEPKS